MKRHVSIMLLPFALLLTLSLALASTASITDAQEQETHTAVLAAKKYVSVTVKCAKVRISNNNAVGYFYATGATEKIAKKNANNMMARGYKAKHCRVYSYNYKGGKSLARSEA